MPGVGVSWKDELHSSHGSVGEIVWEKVDETARRITAKSRLSDLSCQSVCHTSPLGL